MVRNALNNMAEWQQVAFESFNLWMEAGQVMWLRGQKLAEGGLEGRVEAVRMVEEKVEASWQLANQLFWAGPLPTQKAARRSVRHYRGKVAANRRRLSR